MGHMNTPWYVLHAPEIGLKFNELYKLCNEGGVLDKKTKELLMLTVAFLLRSSDCIEEHLEGAFQAGATKEEVIEALFIAVTEADSTQLKCAEQIYSKYLDYNNHK
jgi:AhpD family alkylhydroperoxidase